MANITTIEEALAKVRQNGLDIKEVPKNLITAEICLEAVKEKGIALGYVPKKFMTAEVCLEAVKQHGQTLQDVPEKLKTAELCLAAVKQDGRALQYVPKNLMTASPEEYGAICLEAVKENCWALKDVPWGQLNLTESAKAEICLAAVKQNGGALEYVPAKLRTAEMCIEAVKQNGEALEYVPAKLKTADMCIEAVNKNGNMLKYVPEKLKTEGMCLAAVKQNGNMLHSVPEEFKTAEICLAAVKQCRVEGNYRSISNAIHYVPWDQSNLTDPIKAELCLEAVKQSGSLLQYVPEELMTEELCFEAVRQSVNFLQYVPEKLRTAEVIHEAVKRGCKEIKSSNYSIQHPPNHHLGGMDTARHRGDIEHIFHIFKEISEDLWEEMRIRLKNEGVWVPNNSKDTTAINLGALTQEGICFEFDKLSEKELNSVPPNTPYRNFSVESDFVTDKIKVYVIIPDHREVPKSITLKFTNIGKTAEQQEVVINCNGRFAKAELKGIVILHAIVGRPRNGYKYRQKMEITLNFENRCEPLICPVSRTTTFNMCFFDAYEAQCGKFSSFGTIYEFPDTPV